MRRFNKRLKIHFSPSLKGLAYNSLSQPNELGLRFFQIATLQSFKVQLLH